jgi:hypothetical protein
LLTDYVAKNYGEEAWEKIITRSSKFYRPIYPFSFALKKEIGLTAHQLYKNAYSAFAKEIKPELKDRSQTISLTQKPKVPTQYKFPFKIGDAHYALKESFKKIPHIVKIKEGKESKVTEIGFATEDYLAYRDSLFTWTELSQHPRWTFQNYSDIYLLDLKYGTKRKLTQDGKYFSPDPMRKENLVLAAFMDTSLVSKIAFVNMTTGLPEMLLLPCDNGVVSYPKWINDREMIYISRINDKTAIYHLDLNDLVHTRLLQLSSININEPYVKGRNVFFTSYMDDSDQIFSLNVDNKTLLKHTDEPIGAYSPSVSDEGLVYQTITSWGNDIVHKKDLSGEPYTPAASISNEGGTLVDKLQDTIYKEHNYNKLGSIQLHSYLPIIDQNKIGVSLYWANTLSNIGGETDFYYNANESSIQSNINLSFSSAYPIFDLNVSPSKRSAILLSPSDTLALNLFSENAFNISARLPFEWIYGNYSTTFSPYFGLGHRALSGVDKTIAPTALKSFQEISVGFVLFNGKQAAAQHYGLRYGQELSFRYNGSVNNLKASRLALNGAIYLPGFLTNHRIKLEGSYYSDAALNDYRYPNSFSYPRGVQTTFFSNAIRLGANYGLPLMYPEIGLLDLIYIKRMRMNLFADYGRYNLFKSSTFVKSFGTELLFDNVFFNAVPITLGVRYYYANDIRNTTKTGFNFISSLNF